MKVAIEIGSEFWDVPAAGRDCGLWLDSTQWYLCGRSALYAIVCALHGVRSIAMPSWCCHSMIKPFTDAGITVRFYPVWMEGCLRQEPALTCDALFLMDYFGYTSSTCGRPPGYHGVVIRDVTHSIFSSQYSDADYYFGSLRKWCGVWTGGYAWKQDGGKLAEGSLPAKELLLMAGKPSAKEPLLVAGKPSAKEPLLVAGKPSAKEPLLVADKPSAKEQSLAEGQLLQCSQLKSSIQDVGGAFVLLRKKAMQLKRSYINKSATIGRTAIKSESAVIGRTAAKSESAAIGRTAAKSESAAIGRTAAKSESAAIGRTARRKLDKGYLDLFHQAEELLESCGIAQADQRDIALARKLDVNDIKAKRRKNARVLMDAFPDWLVFKELASCDCPLFVPVIVPDGKRDELRGYLIQKGIYCPVHWAVSGLHSLDERTKLLYGNELSLVCDQRYSQEDMRYMADTIKEFWRKGR